MIPERNKQGRNTQRQPSPRAAMAMAVTTLALALAHALLLVHVGGLPWHWNLFLGPEWLTALVLLVMMPISLRLLWMTRAGEHGQPIRRVLLILLVMVSCAFVLSPGFLLCWPLQVLGLRLTYGHRLDTWAATVLSADTSHLPKEGNCVVLLSHYPKRIDVGVPDFVRQFGSTIYIKGTTPRTRHLMIYNFGGFGAAGFLIGGPSYSATHALRLWDGVYAFNVDSSEPLASDW